MLCRIGGRLTGGLLCVVCSCKFPNYCCTARTVLGSAAVPEWPAFLPFFGYHWIELLWLAESAGCTLLVQDITQPF